MKTFLISCSTSIKNLTSLVCFGIQGLCHYLCAVHVTYIIYIHTYIQAYHDVRSSHRLCVVLSCNVSGLVSQCVWSRLVQCVVSSCNVSGLVFQCVWSRLVSSSMWSHLTQVVVSSRFMCGLISLRL